ncbi:DUF3466 family protein [Echinimonas agarilytica]|uniref:DUF3466 family protein n=1 Tax=Echinimonas agarilytica TaxID=1215918 RepID=A0AA42B8S0_9GAMM|nr:DUF3466 family protein [Echinimonas agarilytica]MCM2681172.1 DUF3466 family protein [Echinimonas agarilytica]
MKQLSMTLKPLSIAVLSACCLSAQAAPLYELTELGVTDDAEVHNYATGGTSPQADSGLVVGMGSIVGQIIFDEDDIDPDDDDNEDDDIITDPGDDDDDDDNEAEEGITDEDLREFTQYRGTYYALYHDSLLSTNPAWTRIRVWDNEVLDDGEYRGTANDYVYGTNDSFVITGTGSAPYYVLRWTDDDDNEFGVIQRDFDSRAFAYRVGDDEETGRVALMPGESTYGGFSEAYAISNQVLDGPAQGDMVVVGSSSVSLTEASEQSVLECLESELEVPEEYCHTFSAYNVEAYLWQVDSNLTEVDSLALGLMFEPSDTFVTNASIYSRAFAVNDNGYVVGESVSYRDLEEKDEVNLNYYAAIYRHFVNGFDPDGEDVILDITDRDEYFRSIAIDINNNNYAVGMGYRNINGVTRTKVFYAKVDEDIPTTTEIPSFFNSSAMTVKDINNDNVMVGEYEWEPRPGGVQRRMHAYAYKIGDDSFVDLNNAIECGSEWNIVEASTIRDDGVILATATKNIPIVDNDGNPIVDEDGNEVLRVVARAVALTFNPDGELQDCENADEAFPDHDRQGAGFGLVSLLLPMGWWMRRRYNRK